MSLEAIEVHKDDENRSNSALGEREAKKLLELSHAEYRAIGLTGEEIKELDSTLKKTIEMVLVEKIIKSVIK